MYHDMPLGEMQEVFDFSYFKTRSILIQVFLFTNSIYNRKFEMEAKQSG